MNSIRKLFINCVCHQMEFESFKNITLLSGSWATIGSQHHEKRREFTFACKVDGRKVSYYLGDSDLRTDSSAVLASDLNSQYDRITRVVGDLAVRTVDLGRIHVSFAKLQRDVLPIVASLVANCSWSNTRVQPAMVTKAFKTTPGFNVLFVTEPRKEAIDFVKQQVRFGNVETIHLRYRIPTKREELAKLAETLKTFASSR